MIESVPGSFRDPDSRVFVQHGSVIRGLSEDAHAGLEAAVAAGLKQHPVVDFSTTDGPDSFPHGVSTPSLPFVSAPREWSFSMLKQAALLTLDLTELAASNGFTMVDAPADNITFAGTEPVFIDLGSFRAEPMRQWAAYGQFCDHFLAPLMLEAYRGVPFQPYVGDQGLSIIDLNQMLRTGDGRRPGVLTHVRLRAMLERRAQRMSVDRRRSLHADAQPGPGGVVRLVQKLRSLVKRLESGAQSEWARYEADCTYEDEEWQRKEDFVRTASSRVGRHGWAYDVGANRGRFTRVLAESFPLVLAMERDPGAVDALLAATRPSSVVHPVVMDVTSPTPNRGLMLNERPSLVDRAPAEFATFLAVVHHLSIGGGIPLSKVVDLMAWTAPEVVVEFIDPNDSRVEAIAANRPRAVRGYTRSAFEASISGRFDTLAQAQLTQTRHIYHLVAT